MATTRPPQVRAPSGSEFVGVIELDPIKPGRHNARYVEYGTHLWAVLNTLRRLTNNGDLATAPRDAVAEAAREWGVSEEAVRAAMRYYDRHRALYDAYFLLQDEEYDERNRQSGD